MKKVQKPRRDIYLIKQMKQKKTIMSNNKWSKLYAQKHLNDESLQKPETFATK